jgi:prepilin-type N-terminal cleavage/methylation domain-containing protein
MRNRRINQKGVTLVEVLISLVILLIVFMGLIQASLVSINSNLRNEMRDEAVRLASEYMSMARLANINNIAGVPGGVPAAVICPGVYTAPVASGLSVPTLNRGIRNTNQPYTVTTTGCYTDSGYGIAEAIITVTYIYPEQPSTDLADPVKRQTVSMNTRVRRQ